MHPSDEHIEDAAFRWLARRDRQLSPAEQDAYLDWLHADPRHQAAITRLSRSWQALDALSEWRPACSAVPNPDLLARPRPRRRTFLKVCAFSGLAAAAALAFGLFASPDSLLSRFQSGNPSADSASSPGIVRHEPRRLTLPDGSIVALLDNSSVRVAYSAEERRVRLDGGEAHFTVAKAPNRPFIVEVKGVAVRAVGTAFNVRVATDAVAVLVTEGQVRLERPAEPAEESVSNVSIQHPGERVATVVDPRTSLDGAQPAASQEGPLLRGGERAVMSLASPSAPPSIAPASSAELEAALEWQRLRLTFNDLPLREVAHEMNQHNRRQLRIGDTAAGDIRIGGTFRADNIEALVRLLQNGFGVHLQTRGDETIVYSRHKNQ